MAEGLSYAEARERLKSEPGRPTEQRSEDAPAVEDMRLTLAAQQQVIVNQQTALAAQVETIATQRDLIALLKDEKARLQAELDELRQTALQQPLPQEQPAVDATPVEVRAPLPSETKASVDQPSPRRWWEFWRRNE